MLTLTFLWEILDPPLNNTTVPTYYSRANDGMFSTTASTSPYCAHTGMPPNDTHWWLVVLEEEYYIDHVIITNRADCCG